MSYCTVEDVKGYYLNKEFKCDDYLDNQEVGVHIAQDAALMDAVIKTRYTLPISDQSDLRILKMINEKMVVGTIDDVFRERTSDEKFDRFRKTRKEALDWLNKIKKGELILDGTEKDSIIKFNDKDSDGNTVEKRFKDGNIEPTNDFQDRERRTIIRVS